MATTLTEAADKALEEHDANISTSTSEGVEKTEEGSKESDKTGTADTESTESVKGADDKTPSQSEEVVNAVNLYKLLQDPDKGVDFIAFLAQQAGLEVNKKTTQQLRKTTEEFLIEQLGEEYSDIGSKLGKAFDVILEQRLKEAIKPIEHRINETESESAERKADLSIEQFLSGNKIERKEWESLESKVAAKMAKMPAAPGADVQEYLTDIWHLVNKEKQTNSTVKNTVKKIIDNANDVRRTSGDVDDSRVRRGSRLPTLDEAIQAALNGERLE